MGRINRARSFALLCAAGQMLVPLLAYAYDVDTHTEMSLRAARQSNLERILPSLGFDSLRDRVTDIDTTRSIEDWIGRGAEDEDDTFSGNFARYRHHFFDPQHDGAGYSFGTVTGEPSPDWALEDKGEFITQSYSFQAARQYFYDALTLPNDNREQWMARTFYALGHVIHHVQDMAQPQHTRNDSHGGGPFGPHSRFERYTDLGNVRPDLPFSSEAYHSQLPVLFDSAREFWLTGDRRGIAEFSSYNFVSFGTNFDTFRYPHPRFEEATPWDDDANRLLQAAGSAVPAECLPPNQPCLMIFYRSRVTDNYRPTASGVNDRTSTLSIFDQDLEVYNKTVSFTDPETGRIYKTKHVFSLNRFNFDAAHEFLIPRAVAYSAGLIDYFVRGRLEAEDIELTDTGIRLRVKNAIDPVETPAWKDEILYAQTTSGGPSQFVVAYEYMDGAGSVHYGSSSPVSVMADITPAQVSSAFYEFQISLSPEARDVKYRLVFRGKLGQEEDAVAVGEVRPLSGFVVTPNYLPDDGIAGRRMIVKSGGQWRLSDKEGLVAGEIDWKGRYVGDRPTRLLSWHGPNARYFPNDDDTFASMFRQQIYQKGEVLAVAPYRVLGAALLKGADGTEWLVAICHDGTDDIVYRRPAIQSDSAALFDPASEPDGWLEIGRLSGEPYLVPDRPWFFNSSGTAAQTLRGAQKSGEEADIPGVKLARLSAVVGADSVVFKETDNLEPLVEKGSNISDPRSITTARVGDHDVWTYEGSRTYSWSESGEYIVAVAYKKDEPIECRLIVDNWYTQHLTGTATEAECRSESCIWDAFRVYQLESMETTEFVRDERLRCGNAEVPVHREHDQTKSEAQFSTRIGFESGHSEKSIAYEYSLDFSRGNLSAADLRHDLMATSTFSEHHQYSEAVTTDGNFSTSSPCDLGDRIRGSGQGVRNFQNVVEVRFKGDLITAYRRAD